MQLTPDLPVDGVALLELAVRALQSEDPAGFGPADGLARTGQLLGLLERLRPVALAAVHDLDLRELYALDACGSTRGWLRTQTCGDTGQLAAARRLTRRPAVRDAADDGRIGRQATDQLCAALTDIERLASPDPFRATTTDPIGEDQLIGLLAHGIPDLLRAWTGTGLDTADLTDRHLDRRAQLAQVLTDAANHTTAAPADRLEPALVLLAHALPPAELPGALAQLVGALQPAGLDATADQQHTRTFFTLTRRDDGMWTCHGLLTDETGTLLHAEIRNRTRRAQQDAAQAAADTAERAAQAAADAAADRADAAGATDAAGPTDAAGATDDTAAAEPDASSHRAAFGTAGPGLPLLPPVPLGAQRLGEPDNPVEGDVHRSYAQHDADALRLLLDDLTGIAPRSGTPAAAQLTVITTDRALTGQPGALPAHLHTTRGPVVLPPAIAQRLACQGSHATVTLHDSGQPLTASGEHRHATRRERRALHAQWGLTCAVNGCTHPGTIPHHVIPFWLSGTTRLKDLIPICPSHHHDIHEGHRTLRLRDGRLINAHGWTQALRTAA